VVSAWKLWSSAGDSEEMVELKFSENTLLIKDFVIVHKWRTEVLRGSN